MSLLVNLEECVEKLRKGIESADWDCVTQAFSLLTGEEIEVETGDENVDLKAIMNRLAKLEGKTTPEKKTRARATSKKKTSVAKTAEKPPGRPNLFEEMDIRLESTERRAEALLNDNVERVPRVRSAFQKKSVLCSDCNLNVLVHPADAKNPYECPYAKAGQSCPDKRKAMNDNKAK